MKRVPDVKPKGEGRSESASPAPLEGQEKRSWVDRMLAHKYGIAIFWGVFLLWIVIALSFRVALMFDLAKMPP